MAPKVKYLILLLMMDFYLVACQMGESEAEASGGNGTAAPPPVAPDASQPRGSKWTNLPPLPPDSGNQNNQAQQDRPPSPAQTPMPSEIPLPGNPLPAPAPELVPIEPLEAVTPFVPIIIGPDYFCEETPPIPVPPPHNCPTCERQCGTIACPNDYCEVKRFCSCDHLCLFFNDCCEGYEEHCPAEHQKAIDMQGTLNKFEGSMESCFSLQAPVQNMKYSMRRTSTPIVVKCPNGDECPRDDNRWRFRQEFNDYIPVLDPHTGFQFASYECAKCNGIDNVIPWQVRIGFEQGPRLQGRDPENPIPFKNYSTVTSLNYQQDFDVFLQHTISVPEMMLNPPNLVSIRQCPTFSVTDTCSESCSQNQELVELCANSPTIYTSIKFDPQRAFRNYYCALCAWTDNMRIFAQPSFASTLVCGSDEILHPDAVQNVGPTVLDIGLQFNNETGLILPHKVMDYCEAKPRQLIPEPAGCPTCQGKCGTVSKLFPENNKRVFCSCDPYCLFYNDCCDRLALHCPDEWEKGIDLLQNLTQYSGVPKCFPSRVNSLSIETPMVCTCGDEEQTTCTDVLKYHDLKRFYLRENIEYYIPVTDLETGIHYASIECARCNNISKFELWKANVNVRHPTMEQDGSEKTEFHLERELPIYINNSIHPVVTFSPPAGTKLRHCYQGYSGSAPQITVHNKCPDSCHNEQLRDLCENGNTLYSKFRYKPFEGFQPQWNRADPTFKNFHCALCHWDRTSEQLYGEDVQSQIVCGGAGDSGRDPSVNAGSWSLTLVFDFSLHEGEKVSQSGGDGKRILKEKWTIWTCRYWDILPLHV